MHLYNEIKNNYIESIVFSLSTAQNLNDIEEIYEEVKSRCYSEKNYYGTGSFEVYATASPKNLSLLKIDNYVSRIDDDNIGVIEKIYVEYDFEIEGLKKEQLTPYYEIFGQDRTLMVLPLKWVLTVLPPSGSLTNFIMGGHVKLKPKKHITIFYYPE